MHLSAWTCVVNGHSNMSFWNFPAIKVISHLKWTSWSPLSRRAPCVSHCHFISYSYQPHVRSQHWLSRHSKNTDTSLFEDKPDPCKCFKTGSCLKNYCVHCPVAACAERRHVTAAAVNEEPAALTPAWAELPDVFVLYLFPANKWIK